MQWQSEFLVNDFEKPLKKSSLFAKEEFAIHKTMLVFHELRGA